MPNVKSEIIEITHNSEPNNNSGVKNLYELNSLIESELQNLGIDPIRWAIVEVLSNTIKISVSHYQKN